MRTAIYGGTFNPIHNGHIHLLAQMQGILHFDRVLLIPSFVPPHKENDDMAPAALRLRMCRRAVEDLSFPAEVSDIEIRREGKSYTADTLQELRRLYPEDRFFFLMGEDMFVTVESWYRPEVIFREAALCAVPRSENGFERMKTFAAEYEKKGAVCYVEDVSVLDISSTMIRSLTAEGKPIDGLTPPRVARVIRQKGLYREASHG